MRWAYHKRDELSEHLLYNMFVSIVMGCPTSELCWTLGMINKTVVQPRSVLLMHIIHPKTAISLHALDVGLMWIARNARPITCNNLKMYLATLRADGDKKTIRWLKNRCAEPQKVAR